MMLPQKKLLLLLTTLLFAFLMSSVPVDENPSVTIRLQAIPGLQYDQVRFSVKPGTTVELILTNADDMSHNLLITEPGAREEVVLSALQLGEAGPTADFIPDIPQVLWSIPVLSPGETKSVTFTAPQTLGIYPYVCTYPGHGAVMYGAMYVTEEALPALAEDPNIPSARRVDRMQAGDSLQAGPHQTPKQWHPYEPVPPYWYRVFIPGASPAAMAVCLPDSVSYCWDAGTCRLRFAWQGGFVDNSQLWKGKGDVSSIILGTIFFRDKTDYPLRTGTPDHIPVVAFKGFRLIDRYPEFHYTLDGMDVYELIKPGKKTDGTAHASQGHVSPGRVSLTRTFRMPQANQTLWFAFHPDDGVDYQASAGVWKEGLLKLSPQEARQFTIHMTPKEGVKL